MLLFILLITINIVYTSTISFSIPDIVNGSKRASLNGTWQLDRETSESLNDVLDLMGIGWVKRRIITGLDMTEQYTITSTTFHFIRDTQRSHQNLTFLLNIEENVEDELLGEMKQIVTYNPGGKFNNIMDTGSLIIEIIQPFNATSGSIL